MYFIRVLLLMAIINLHNVPAWKFEFPSEQIFKCGNIKVLFTKSLLFLKPLTMKAAVFFNNLTSQTQSSLEISFRFRRTRLWILLMKPQQQNINLPRNFQHDINEIKFLSSFGVLKLASLSNIFKSYLPRWKIQCFVTQINF